MAQTKTLLSNKTKLVERRTPAFMAQEILVDTLNITSVGIEQLKPIHNWALVIGYFKSRSRTLVFLRFSE